MNMTKSGAGVSSNRKILGVMVLLAFSIIGFITILVITGIQGGHDRQYIRYAGELRVLSQEIAKNAGGAVYGREEGFSGLNDATNKFARYWEYLENGNPEEGLPASPPLLQYEMSAVKAIWRHVQLDARQILNSQESLVPLNKVGATLKGAVPALQAEYDEVVAMLLANNASSDKVVKMQRQPWLAERILGNVTIILEGGGDAELAADSLVVDLKKFGDVYNATLKGGVGSDAQRNNRQKIIFDNITTQHQLIAQNGEKLVEASPELFQMRDAANTISEVSAGLLEATSALAEHFQNLPKERFIQAWMGYICGILALAIIALLGVIIYQGTRARLLEQSDANKRNQAAILRLLDEIADLADGDLTASAAVTEEITGAIADSINFAIDQLRSLVIAINQNSTQVLEAAREAQSTASHLSDASTSQALQIREATSSINQIANSLDAVSGSAEESSKVAERSVVIANKGAGAVQNTINGMESIREQIQKTSKQIKRLGESSQEIGDIVSLINDIADQTNILSLNAAIQASMAGDAGRGFAVVADEVQRLAERSSAATKQIEVLVKTIQADTNDAVISMEQTTAEVVQGARLAQDAGVALGEIEEVSNDLAKLIQEISDAAGTQSQAANHISSSMNIIQEITSQATSGTTATAASIGRMAEMATEMSNAVAGFKLPQGDIKQSVSHEDTDGLADQDASVV